MDKAEKQNNVLKSRWLKIFTEWKKIENVFYSLILFFLVEQGLLYFAYRNLRGKVYDVFVILILVLNFVHFKLSKNLYLKKENTKLLPFLLWYHSLYFLLAELAYQIINKYLLYCILEMTDKAYIFSMIALKNTTIILLMFEVLCLFTVVFYAIKWFYKKIKNRFRKSKTV